MLDARLRILVFDLPPLMRDLVCRALDATEEMTSFVAASGELEHTVAVERPDAVIVALDGDALPPEGRRFLEARARLRVLGLGVRDGRAVLYELRRQRSELGEVEPNQLAMLIRTALIQETGV